MSSEPPQIDVAQAMTMLDQRARLLDVREDDEWDAGHAPNAEHRPLGQVDPSNYTGGDTIIVVCRSGNRSRKAAVALQGVGVNVYNLDGGMEAWSRAGHPVVRDDGSAGTVA